MDNPYTITLPKDPSGKQFVITNLTGNPITITTPDSDDDIVLKIRGLASQIFGEDNHVYYDAYKTDNLKCKCYVCEKEITPTQTWEYASLVYRISMKCCAREETVKLTEAQIKLNNETGFYFAFMGIK